MNKDNIQLHKECQVYKKALQKLPDKDHIKVSLAGISYITNGTSVEYVKKFSKKSALYSIGGRV